MLYAFAHFLRDKIPFLWDFVDIVNSFLFSLRYGRKLKSIEAKLSRYEEEHGYKVLPINIIDAHRLELFFTYQPDDSYEFFKPHGFDGKTIKKLQKNKAFLAYVIENVSDGSIVGYCFIRSFFHGKGFRGRMVSIDYRGKGLGTMMNRLLNEVGFGIGLRLFETVNKENVASYRSALSASRVRVIQELPHNVLYLEILKD